MIGGCFLAHDSLSLRLSILTIPLKSLPVTPLSYSPDLLWIDGLPWN